MAYEIELLSVGDDLYPTLEAAAKSLIAVQSPVPILPGGASKWWARIQAGKLPDARPLGLPAR